ncbi:CHAT domain-containing protein [Diplogelasinospora grovesii]|uniref:CHAT domain-containing protein n=1 Tax=Diplogelasinospora grovesii TaxID=303347 RepID=A0AAN6S3F9_9PEZI|nr:CHAT domain-containing protein [Diplogelasinospora grovesii]
MEDLEQAIRRAQEAVALTHWRHPKRASYLNGLGNAWAWKYRRTKDPADICQAIFYLELAIDFSPPNLPDRLSWLSNLGTISSWRYEQTGALSDLEYAISRTEQAMKTMPDNHPNRALSHSSLGDLLCCRHDRTRRRLDIEGSLRHYKSSWGFVNAPPVVRIKAAHKAGGILLSLDGWQESSELLQQAVHLLQSISAGNLQQQDQQHMLGEFAGLATLAASAALQAGRGPIHTLRLLELGRGVMAGLRFGSHRDALSPRKRLPELPERLGQGQDSPNSTSSRQLTVNVRETSQQCCKTEGANQMRTIRQSVRSTSLLLSPTEIELQSAASNGPIVVINTSPARCDALLVSNDGVRSIHLHGLRYVDIVEKAQLLHSLKVVRAASSPSEEIVRRSSDHMVQILEWLWLAAASPILAELGYRGPPRQGDNWPRTWWIPTGLLSLLPLHAAGRHGAAGGGTDTVIDRVISSYSPSLRALLHTQQRPRDDYRIPPRDALLVSMETTPDCSSLHKVGAEVTAVTRFLSSGLCLKRPTVMQQPRKEQVLAGLKSCDIFHFAGHAMSDPADPSKSHLLLQDWQQDPLTVQDLTELDRGGIENPHPPFLAYLSACSTGIMSPAESRLYDESITLMTACQMAGFRHTVGSLWDVCDDDHSVETASEFYKALGREFETLEDSAVALGVHSAARHIRDMTRGNSCFFSEQGDPFAWAAFIHMGP